MRIEDIKREVEREYGFNVTQIEKVKNVFKIRVDSNEEYSLKVINYQYKHFNFILSAIKHLVENGYDDIIPIIKTASGKDFITIGTSYCYMTRWFKVRQANYDNMLDIKLVAGAMARLHKCSKGFCVKEDMRPRVAWEVWPNIFNTRLHEVLDFKKRILAKEKKSEFDQRYLNIIQEEFSRGERSVKRLIESNYYDLMLKERQDSGFCHHDFAHHNVLIENNNKVRMIDFDYCILDTHLHDLSSLIIRKMKNGKWDLKEAKYIIDEYDSIYRVTKEEIEVMAAFICFPQEFWQLGIQYYWEKQAWDEELFHTKLNKIIEDKSEREEFTIELNNSK